ncbi:MULTISPECIES: D-lactate dehydrogenase [unclassified Neisseria]|uniref:D-lactate dehydrogenase n=1 Tax=unclassified Neisseria TaxID=2623750 RepID=UPI002664EA37|nr:MULTISPECIES: D-lactate dehydrogenase [unclassified Neisseria]MDO1510480.1 D-lactate dehydrogenase [Neisseria sp. MVDL19-042950]MDO1516649.1 D-lactate dehydrogenase [Neisseria sp. MVDL18-041461]MDO1563795.1 D-lactate dehydrogenase [Neisseria sp. MVDL20-010259]
MTATQLIQALTDIVGRPYIITDPAKTEPYRQGYRFGEGKALAVVRPGTLLEQWKVLQACVEADVIVLTQAANTGLTGGSTPDGNDYDRDIVIVNTMRMDIIRPINNNEQVVCLPGATLNQLELLLKPLGREPHSVIGSSCIGASVLGGVCNNSGGALVQRGPAYTEMALFAQIDEQGKLHLINHLGIDLGETPEEILTNLQGHHYQQKDITREAGKGHDHAYCNHVRQVDEPSAARFNADPARHYEASGCAGKLMVFAVRLDTFPLEKNTAVFYIGTNDTQELTDIRRTVLGSFKNLPVSGEYIHRDAFDMAAEYGKDTFWVIKKFGTHRLPQLFDLKARADRVGKKLGILPAHFTDKALQFISKYLPEHLPQSLRDYRNRYEHHLILKMGGEGVEEARAFLKTYFAEKSGAYFECSPEETQAAMLHRFAVAGAAVRYRAVHDQEVEDIVALDIALRRNDDDWFERLPSEIDSKISHKLYYGHFMCHVFHQDYIVKKGHNCMDLEHQMLELLDQRGAQYPAEHNVGHLYEAKPALKQFYRQLDPTNSFNPGIGKTSKKKDWAE